MRTKGLIAAGVLALGLAVPTHRASAGFSSCMELATPTEYSTKCADVFLGYGDPGDGTDTQHAECAAMLGTLTWNPEDDSFWCENPRVIVPVTTEVVTVDIAGALVVERTAAQPIMAMPKFMG